MTRTMFCARSCAARAGAPRHRVTCNSTLRRCATSRRSRLRHGNGLAAAAGHRQPGVGGWQARAVRGGLDGFPDLEQHALPSANVDIEDVKRDLAAKLERRWPKLLAAATAACVASAWSADARACLARVNTEKDAEVCTRWLKGSQVRRLKAVILRIARGDQPGIDQLIAATLLPEACAVYRFYSWRARTCTQLPGPERDRIADDLARMSAGWDLDGDTDILSAPCQTAADRIAARFEAVGCKLDDGLGLEP